MELEQWRKDFDRRLEEGRREIRERVAKGERRRQEAGEARRLRWEEVEGGVRNGHEKQEPRSDSFLRLVAAMTEEYVAIARSIDEDIRSGFAESRAETQAQTEALLRMLDRRPP